MIGTNFSMRFHHFNSKLEPVHVIESKSAASTSSILPVSSGQKFVRELFNNISINDFIYQSPRFMLSAHHSTIVFRTRNPRIANRTTICFGMTIELWMCYRNPIFTLTILRSILNSLTKCLSFQNHNTGNIYWSLILVLFAQRNESRKLKLRHLLINSIYHPRYCSRRNVLHNYCFY